MKRRKVPSLFATSQTRKDIDCVAPSAFAVALVAMGPPTAPEPGKARRDSLRACLPSRRNLTLTPARLALPQQEGLKAYYKAKIEEAEIAVRNKTQNLRRLEAQRNELNTKGARVAVRWLAVRAARHGCLSARA